MSEPKDELPEGWVAARLVDVFFLNPPKPKAGDYAENLPVSFVPMPAVDAVTGSILSPVVRNFSEVRKGFTSFKDEDLIIAKITPCMENGKAAIARGLMNGRGFGSTEFHVLRSKGVVLSEYLFHFVRQETFRRSAEAEMTGSVGQKRVPAEFLQRVSLPVPPLPEQQRIVAAINALLQKMSSARERLEQMPLTMKRLRKAVLAAACSGRLTADWRGKNFEHLSASETLSSILNNISKRKIDETELPEIPESWVWLALPDTGELNRGRSRNRPRNLPHLYGGPYPFIQTGDIANSGGRITSHRQTYSEAGLEQSRLWPAGTVCITIAANIADSAILTYPTCFPDSVVGASPNPKIAIPEYLEFFIRTARENLAAFAPATAQANINIAILNEVAVPVPPLDEQKEIVRRASALLSLADSIEQHAKSALERVKLLTQSVLAKAFRGELVPTEADLARREKRSYQPASELLARLKTSMNDEPKQTRARKSSMPATYSDENLLEFMEG